MRTAELAIAAALMLFSAYLMWHATVLPIGWVQGSGPGGGAFPFWLAAGMFVTAGCILARELRPAAAEKRAGRIFIDPRSYATLAVVAGSLVAAIALTQWIGAYAAIMLFLLFQLRIVGGHGWPLTILLTIATPIFIFFFFEVTLKILLPKGVTEPLFFPLYAMFF